MYHNTLTTYKGKNKAIIEGFYFVTIVICTYLNMTLSYKVTRFTNMWPVSSIILYKTLNIKTLKTNI